MVISAHGTTSWSCIERECGTQFAAMCHLPWTSRDYQACLMVLFFCSTSMEESRVFIPNNKCRLLILMGINDNMSELWYKMFSHISEMELDFLAKKSLLPGVKDVKLEMTCNHCLVEKQRRVSFKHHSSSRKE